MHQGLAHGTPFYVGSQSLAEKVEKEVACASSEAVIFLFMNGAPSQQDLFDYKPMVEKYHGQELFKTFDSDSGEWSDEGFAEKTQRLTGMTSGQKSFPIADRSGSSNSMAKVVLGSVNYYRTPRRSRMIYVLSSQCIPKRSITIRGYFQTSHQQPGRPSMGAWMSYGLGSSNENLPTFCVLISNGTGRPGLILLQIVE